MADMSWIISETAETYKRLLIAEEERRLRVVLDEWLPRPLCWLKDHPQLLKLYLKLPHRTEIVGTCEYPYAITSYAIQPRGASKAKES